MLCVVLQVVSIWSLVRIGGRGWRKAGDSCCKLCRHHGEVDFGFVGVLLVVQLQVHMKFIKSRSNEVYALSSDLGRHVLLHASIPFTSK